MKAGILIQSRISSTRLPCKALLDLDGVTLLGRLIERMYFTKLPIIVVTSNLPEDDLIEIEAKKYKVDYVFRGSLNNVRSRFYMAAKKLNIDVIVRVTGDNPFSEPTFVCQAIEYIKNGAHYASAMSDLCPDGSNIEAFSFSELEKSEQEDPEGLNKYDVEHVTPEIKKRNFNSKSYVNFKPYESLGKLDSSYHIGVDTLEDYVKVRRIYQMLKKSELNDEKLLFNICDILQRNPNFFKKGRRYGL